MMNDLLKRHLVMPDDVTIKSVTLDEMRDCFVIKLQSKSFEKVPEGQIAPQINDGIVLKIRTGMMYLLYHEGYNCFQPPAGI